MQRPKWTSRLTLFAIAVVAFAPFTAQAGCRSRFNCSPGSSPYCYFSLKQGANLLKKFTIEAGGSSTIYGLQPDISYCSSIRGWPDLDACDLKPIKMVCD